MVGRRVAVLLVTLVAVLAVAAPAHAHPMRSAMVEIEEAAPGRGTVHLRTSVPDPGLSVAIDGCAVRWADEAETQLDRTGTAECGGGSLAGHEVAVDGLGPVLSEAVVWFHAANGATTSHLLARDAPSWTLPAEASWWTVARQYVALGVEHILTGFDHLLFLVLLVLTLKKPRAVLLAETAFTLSHSISFSATALGWIRVSPAAAEACIALSLVLVALDVEPKKAAPTAWAGAGLAFLFGLVHGLGFAGGLREIGLPDGDAAAALVAFGAGVEIGQVAFLLAVLALVRWASRLRRWPKVALGGAYAGGAVACSWLIERGLACLHGG